MKIRLLSDVHHEFYEDKDLYANKGEDVLVVAGDLAVGHLAVWSALKQFADHTEHVVYISGNHEHYHTEIPVFDDYISRFSKGTNIHFLNPGTIRIQDVTFIGGTLWTNFRDNQFSKMYCGKAINDFRTIRNFDTQKCVDIYNKHIAYFKEAEQKIEGKKVFVSHFLPAIECIASEYRGEGAINDYFANDLAEWISYMEESTWLYGHSHTPSEILIGDTRVINNAYGYNKNPYFKERLIEV